MNQNKKHTVLVAPLVSPSMIVIGIAASFFIEWPQALAPGAKN